VLSGQELLLVLGMLESPLALVLLPQALDLDLSLDSVLDLVLD